MQDRTDKTVHHSEKNDDLGREIIHENFAISQGSTIALNIPAMNLKKPPKLFYLFQGLTTPYPR
jgi:hypothetical protein